MQFSQEHEGIRRSVKRLIDEEINPNVEAWEAAGSFPAHELFRKMGRQGFFGINKPVASDLGLDYSYRLVFLECLGHIRCDVTMLASMARLKSGRLSREISDACLQYWGGMGFHERDLDQPRLSPYATWLHRWRRR